MTTLEDPRKEALRARAEAALDAAGFSVDLDRPTIPYPEGSKLKGTIKADVVATDSAGGMNLYYTRVDGSRPVPQWLAQVAEASFSLDGVCVHILVEQVGDSLTETSKSAGIGVVQIDSANTLDVILEYAPPDLNAQTRRFTRRLRDAQRKLDTKFRNNSGRLQTSFNESQGATSGMSPRKRDEYLDSIEGEQLAWHEWLDDLNERIDGLAGSLDLEALETIEKEIVRGARA